MLLQGLGEGVAAVPFGDEEEVLGFRCLQDALQRSQSWIADGTGRQAGVPVGVVRGVELQVYQKERTFPPRAGVRLVAETILDCRISVEEHLLFQALQKDSSDERSFLS